MGLTDEVRRIATRSMSASANGACIRFGRLIHSFTHSLTSFFFHLAETLPGLRDILVDVGFVADLDVSLKRSVKICVRSLLKTLSVVHGKWLSTVFGEPAGPACSRNSDLRPAPSQSPRNVACRVAPKTQQLCPPATLATSSARNECQKYSQIFQIF